MKHGGTQGCEVFCDLDTDRLGARTFRLTSRGLNKPLTQAGAHAQPRRLSTPLRRRRKLVWTHRRPCGWWIGQRNRKQAGRACGCQLSTAKRSLDLEREALFLKLTLAF